MTFRRGNESCFGIYQRVEPAEATGHSAGEIRPSRCSVTPRSLRLTTAAGHPVAECDSAPRPHVSRDPC